MPSTYSNQGLELIATGEQEATWGDTTNSNWELIDEASDGVINITSSNVTQTLAITNGASSNGRHKVLRFTGSPTGTITATIDPNTAQKWYIVWNETGENVEIAQGSGANATIKTGTTAVVYADGAGSGASVFNITDKFGLNAPQIAGGTITGATISGSTINNNVTGNLEGNLTGTPTAPTPAIGDDTQRVATTEFVRNILPSGIISMWSGAIGNIPSGWLLCDGANGTPDLRDRFVIGAGNDFVVDETGGQRDATLPAHKHSVSITSGGQSNTHSHSGSTSSAGTHTHVTSGSGSNAGGTSNITYWSSSTSGTRSLTSDPAGSHTHSVNVGNASQNHTHNVNGDTNNTGESATDANLPPFYALAYIMKE